MLLQHALDLVLQQGPKPPDIFGDASSMPGMDKLQNAFHWVGWIVTVVCVIGVVTFGAQLVVSHNKPGHHAGEHGKNAGMIVLGLTIVGSAGGLVTYFTSK